MADDTLTLYTMSVTSIIIPILTLVVIFLFGIQKFSKQIDQVAGERFKRILATLTRTPLRGVALGAGVTAGIQSSTATVVILMSLVNAGAISFANSVGVIFGANIGTTLTSQLIAFHVTSIAPYFVLLGFVVTYFGRSYNHWGKPIFYFGLVFFSLSLISLYLEPVKSDPNMIRLFEGITNVYMAVMVGFIFTAIIQSSSVTSWLAVLLAGAGLLTLDQSIGVILGANIGTTTTALIAAAAMHAEAKKVALAHFLFNVCSVLLFLPFIHSFTAAVRNFGGAPEQMVANAHLFFNLISVILFLIVVKPFTKLVASVVDRRAAPL